MPVKTKPKKLKSNRQPKPRRKPNRQSEAERLRKIRASEKLIRLTTLSPEDRRVRLWREEDDEDWLRAYWSAFSPDEFYSLSPQQRQMVADFRAALEHGGDRAIAASRGEGKTTFAVALTLKEILRGKIRFAVLLAATADNVAAILSGINTALSESLELRRYYPEVCECVADVSGAPQRAKSQIASGDRFDNGQPYEMAKTKFHWAGNELIFPNVPGSPSAGAIIKAKSLESPIRGLKIANRRPDIVLIDDPDTDEALDVETQILTTQGFKRIGDIEVGDIVYGTDGKTCNVIGTSEVKTGRVCYRVTFDDGAEVVCDAGHLWTTSTALQRTNQRRKRPDNEAWSSSRPQCRAKPYETVRTTQEIYETLHGESQRKNHSIQMQGSLCIEDSILPLDPYVLGVWLGDGTNRSPEITSMDDEIIQQIVLSGHAVSRIEIDKRGNKAKRYVFPSIRKPIARLGMMCCTKRIEKFVPEQYLISSEAQRLSLLQGLMDTDGSIDGRYGRCVFANTNKSLVDSVVYLCDSLGIKCRVHSVPMSGIMKSPAWKVEFTTTRKVFRLERKLKSIPLENRKNIGRRYIQSVNQVNSRPVKCIKVDSEDHLFLCTKRLIPTHNTINNPDQATKLLTKIDRSISALGSQKRPISRMAMVTIASQCSAAAQLTDRAKYPSWRGRRFKFLLTPPADAAKWEQFINLCREGWAKSADDDREPPIPIAAHRFYLDNREAMDAGSAVSNPNRFDHRLRPEGGTVEVSALEHYYGFVARNGPAAAQAELDNDPPEIGGVDDDGLSPHRVQHQVSGFQRRAVPSLCELLTMGVDVGKFLLHWVVIAWRTDGTSYVIDYGISKVHGTTRGTEEGMEQAIVSAIRILCSEKTDDPYTNAAGEIIPIALTLVDEGWGVSTSAVRAACRDLRPDVFPAKGEGDGATGEGGRSAGPYHHAQKRTWDILPGDNWRRVTMRKDRIKLYHHNAGYWKDWGIQRWLTPIDRPGCRFVFGEFSERDKEHVAMHAEFSHQVCANCYRDEMKHGRLVRCWGERPGENGDKDHYQDAQELADVAANVMGVRLEALTAAADGGGTGGKPAADAIEEVALGSIGGAVVDAVTAPVRAAVAPAAPVRRVVEIEEVPLCEMRR